MEGRTLKVDKTEIAVTEFRQELTRLHKLNKDMEETVKRPDKYKVPSVASASAVSGEGVGRGEVGEGTRPSKKPRGDGAATEAIPTLQSQSASDGWQKVTATRPPPAQAGRVQGGGPSADDRRTVVVRGLPGQIMRNKLPEFLWPVL